MIQKQLGSVWFDWNGARPMSGVARLFLLVAMSLAVGQVGAQPVDGSGEKLLGIDVTIGGEGEGGLLDVEIGLGGPDDEGSPLDVELDLGIDLPLEGELTDLLPLEGELTDILPIEGELIDLPLEGELIDLLPIEGELIDLPIEGELIDLPIEGELLDLLPGLIDLLGGLVDLPLPIFGPDAFEPDNTPALAVWAGLQDLTELLLSGLLPRVDTHNLHVPHDEDWKRFHAEAGAIVHVETRNVLPLADTYLEVYRLVEEGESPPLLGPQGCGDSWVTGPDGELLLLVGCNDDTGEPGPQGIRSVVEFVADRTGTYFSRVTLSPKAMQNFDAMQGDKDMQDKQLSMDGSETTYNYVAVSKGMVSASVYCTVRTASGGAPVRDARVTLQQLGATVRQNTDGVYVFNGVPEGQYTVRAEAAGYTAKQTLVAVSAGSAAQTTLNLDAAGGAGNEGENAPEGEPVPEGESEGGGEGAPEGEGSSEGETEPAGPRPAFDFKEPRGVVTLPELLRAVQLYNARQYHCSPGTEDGYAPNPGSLQCAPHPLDSRIQDWSIDLSELLRMIQFYSLGGYRACPLGEGGLCAGR